MKVFALQLDDDDKIVVTTLRKTQVFTTLPTNRQILPPSRKRLASIVYDLAKVLKLKKLCAEGKRCTAIPRKENEKCLKQRNG